MGLHEFQASMFDETPPPPPPGGGGGGGGELPFSPDLYAIPGVCIYGLGRLWADKGSQGRLA